MRCRRRRGPSPRGGRRSPRGRRAGSPRPIRRSTASAGRADAFPGRPRRCVRRGRAGRRRASTPNPRRRTCSPSSRARSRAGGRHRATRAFRRCVCNSGRRSAGAAVAGGRGACFVTVKRFSSEAESAVMKTASSGSPSASRSSAWNGTSVPGWIEDRQFRRDGSAGERAEPVPIRPPPARGPGVPPTHSSPRSPPRYPERS